MKKVILFLMLAFVFSLTTQAQTNFRTSGGLTYDTLTNAETAYLIPDKDFPSGKTLAIIAFADTLSGTDAVITVVAEGWINSSTGWAPLETAKSLIDTTSAGAVAVTEASVFFVYERIYLKRYRLKFTQTGTATTLIKGSYYLKSR